MEYRQPTSVGHDENTFISQRERVQSIATDFFHRAHANSTDHGFVRSTGIEDSAIRNE